MTNINPAMAGMISISAADISSMDIEALLMFIQGQRTQLLDRQLKDQIEEVNQRNQLTAKLNDMQGKLNALKAAFKSDAKPSDRVPNTAENRKLAEEYAMAALNAGMPTDPVKGTPIKDSSGNITGFKIDSLPTKEGVEKSVTQIKSQLDSSSNTQQMDMLRLQQLSNKRNEAFDIMTNFVKKMQDSRSSIIGNLR